MSKILDFNPFLKKDNYENDDIYEQKTTLEDMTTNYIIFYQKFRFLLSFIHTTSNQIKFFIAFSFFSIERESNLVFMVSFRRATINISKIFSIFDTIISSKLHAPSPPQKNSNIKKVSEK